MRTQLTQPYLVQQALAPDFELVTSPYALTMFERTERISASALALRLQSYKTIAAVNVIFVLVGLWGLVIFWSLTSRGEACRQRAHSAFLAEVPPGARPRPHPRLHPRLRSRPRPHSQLHPHLHHDRAAARVRALQMMPTSETLQVLVLSAFVQLILLCALPCISCASHLHLGCISAGARPLGVRAAHPPLRAPHGLHRLL